MLKPHEIIGHYDKAGFARLVHALEPDKYPRDVGPETQRAVEDLGTAIAEEVGLLLRRHRSCPPCKLSEVAYAYLALGVLMAQEQAERERERLTAEIGKPDDSA